MPRIIRHVFIDYTPLEHLMVLVGYLAVMIAHAYAAMRALYIAVVIGTPLSPVLSVSGCIESIGCSGSIGGSGIENIKADIAAVFPSVLWDQSVYVFAGFLAGLTAVSYPFLYRLRTLYVPLFFRLGYTHMGVHARGLLLMYSIAAPFLAGVWIIPALACTETGLERIIPSAAMVLAAITAVCILIATVLYESYIMLGRIDIALAVSLSLAVLLAAYTTPSTRLILLATALTITAIAASTIALWRRAVRL